MRFMGAAHAEQELDLLAEGGVTTQTVVIHAYEVPRALARRWCCRRATTGRGGESQ
jgi:hypothetical protein